jgi:hypothetical protein
MTSFERKTVPFSSSYRAESSSIGSMTWMSAGWTTARWENLKMFMNSWANMVASTADNADAADPGVDGGTVEAELPSANGGYRGCSAWCSLCARQRFPLICAKAKWVFGDIVGGIEGKVAAHDMTRRGKEGQEASREGCLYE